MEELQKKLVELESRLNSLQTENDELKRIQTEGLKKQYEEISEAIQYAVEHGDRLESAHKDLEGKMSQSALLVRFTEVNNPHSEVLGFKFTEVVKNMAAAHFTQKITDQEVKDNFSKVVNRVVNNPVVATLLNTNPVTGMVYRVVDKITDFSNNNPLGIRLNKWAEDVKGVFDDERIKGFVESFNKYIFFYDALLKASEQYHIASEGLTQRRESLGKVLNTYHSDLLKELGIQPKQGVSSLSSLNKILSVDGKKYQTILNNPKIMSAYDKAREYRNLEERFNNLLHDYNGIVVQLLDAYLAALGSLEGSALGDFDPQKVKQLVTSINNLKSTLR